MTATRRLFFLPGAAAFPRYWRPLGERLPESWEKTYFGWPGIGDERPDPSVKGFDDLVRLVESRLGDSPVDLLGQSMGGPVAMRVALNHPDKVRRIVLAVTSGGLDVAALGAADWRGDYRRQYPNADSWILESRPDYSAELHKLTQPTLLLWGDADPISPTAVGKKLAGLLPNAALVVVPGGTHALVRDRVPDIIEAVRRHLE